MPARTPGDDRRRRHGRRDAVAHLHPRSLRPLSEGAGAPFTRERSVRCMRIFTLSGLRFAPRSRVRRRSSCSRLAARLVSRRHGRSGSPRGRPRESDEPHARCTACGSSCGCGGTGRRTGPRRRRPRAMGVRLPPSAPTNGRQPGRSSRGGPYPRGRSSRSTSSSHSRWSRRSRRPSSWMRSR